MSKPKKTAHVLKAFIAMMLALALVLSMAGCRKQQRADTPEKAIELFFSYFAAGEYKAAGKYVYESENIPILSGSEPSELSTMFEYARVQVVEGAVIDAQTGYAVVDVRVTAVDLKKIWDETLLPKLYEDALRGQSWDEEKTTEMLRGELATLTREGSAPMRTSAVSITAVPDGNQWLVSLDQTLLDAITGGLVGLFGG